jgi:hypothetical protein
MTCTRPGVAAALASLLLVGVACSDNEEPDLSVPSDVATRADSEETEDSTDPLMGETFHVAQAVEDTLVVRTAAQDGADELMTLEAGDEVSGKIICLVSQQVGSWVEVHLPSGPADRTGWVARDDVTLSRHRFRIEVSLSSHTLTLYTGEVVALTTPVAVGPDAPPAGEELFIKDLVETPNPSSPYGAYAYGLSGSDNELDDFTTGNGVVAVHGTADPTALDGDAPYGAIAVGDDIITRFVETIGLPLGTPVDILE